MQVDSCPLAKLTITINEQHVIINHGSIISKKLQLENTTNNKTGGHNNSEEPAVVEGATASLSLNRLSSAQAVPLSSSPLGLTSTIPGKGVFASAPLAAGTMIDTSPVLLLSEEEYHGAEGEGKGVEGSALGGKVVRWEGEEGGWAIALGLGSLFSRSSSSPNVRYTLHPSSHTISYTTLRAIDQGEELCIASPSPSSSTAEPTADAEELGVPSALKEGEGQWDALLGVEGVAGDAEGAGRKKAGRGGKSEKEQKEWDDQIVPFAELEWNKVTNIVDPENMPLSTFPAYIIPLPARHAQLAFSFVRKHSASFSELGHLKRVRPISSTSSTTGADTPISVLLFPLHSAPADLPALLAASPLAAALSPELIPALEIVEVPATIARTDAQAREWGKIWPVQMVHIREGPKALPRAKGWERAKVDWVRREGKRVWDKAREAGVRGELPIACHITHSYSSLLHSSSSPPSTLVRCSDTRLSTGNVLCHAASNAIDAVGVLDRADARPAVLSLENGKEERPYLLTGLTVFLSHEPCLLCAMSLLHSRVKELYYVRRSPGGGGLGSTYAVHEDEGLNHRFEVWEWVGGMEGEAEGEGMGMGEGCEVRCDC